MANGRIPVKGPLCGFLGGLVAGLLLAALTTLLVPGYGEALNPARVSQLSAGFIIISLCLALGSSLISGVIAALLSRNAEIMSAIITGMLAVLLSAILFFPSGLSVYPLSYNLPAFILTIPFAFVGGLAVAKMRGRQTPSPVPTDRRFAYSSTSGDATGPATFPPTRRWHTNLLIALLALWSLLSFVALMLTLAREPAGLGWMGQYFLLCIPCLIGSGAGLLWLRNRWRALPFLVLPVVYLGIAARLFQLDLSLANRQFDAFYFLAQVPLAYRWPALFFMGCAVYCFFLNKWERRTEQGS